MSDDRLADPIPEPEIPAAERAEERAIRRRWITLGEIVAIAAVAISGLTFWSNYSDRKASEAERHAERAEAREAEAHVTLTGTPASGGHALAIGDSRQKIQGIKVRFPAALGIGSKESLLEPKIEARWFAGKLLDMTDGGPDKRDGTMPVLITADWWDGDQHLDETALYDIVWHTEGRVLQGRELKLKGIALRRRLKGDGPAQLDAAWARAKP